MKQIRKTTIAFALLVSGAFLLMMRAIEKGTFKSSRIKRWGLTIGIPMLV